jgi:hypothetical protein
MVPRAWSDNSFPPIDVRIHQGINDIAGIRMGGGLRHRRLNPTQSREETIANGT